MPPVKRKKNKSKKTSSLESPLTAPVALTCVSSAAIAPANSPASEEAISAKPSPFRNTNSAGSGLAPATTTEVADQLHSAAIHLLRRLRVRDRESGVGPAQLSALSVLVFGGPKSLGELADAEHVRPPTMSRIVAGLERSRLVRRHATEDGRRVRLEATPKGVSLMWEGRKRRVESLAQALAALPENERTQLREAIALLQQVIRGL
ncbi:MAG: MarR family transcriptional regulator [Candidatus Acidiferrum sp.]